MTLISYQHINDKNQHLVGQKAYKLALINNANIPIAPFYVLPVSFFHQVSQNSNLPKLVNNLLTYLKISRDDPNQLKTGLSLIRLKISQYRFPNNLIAQISQIFNFLKTGSLAIRSSASCEDGVNSSFAGQFASVLSVTKSDIVLAIKKCLASVFTEQVYLYCQFHKVDFSKITMAVMLQKMIKADVGGVMFTQDVFNHHRQQVIIEAAKGLGENVVSGLVNPQKLVFNKLTSKLDKNAINFHNSILTTKQVNSLFQIAIKIEKLFGCPQDIEWAIEKGKIYILQSRPIA